MQGVQLVGLALLLQGHGRAHALVNAQETLGRRGSLGVVALVGGVLEMKDRQMRGIVRCGEAALEELAGADDLGVSVPLHEVVEVGAPERGRGLVRRREERQALLVRGEAVLEVAVVLEKGGVVGDDGGRGDVCATDSARRPRASRRRPRRR